MGKWYLRLKDYMAQSRSHWNYLYPEFRAHVDGDKLEAYKIVENHVKIPTQYLKLSSVRLLTEKHLKQIPVDAFVIKAILGNQARRVICLHRTNINRGKMQYKDILRHKTYSMSDIEAISYVIHMFQRDEERKGSALIIEEFVGNPNRGLPQDYKLYTINKKVRLISVFGRRGKDEYAYSYNRHWKPININDMYKDPESLDYIDEQLDPLPSKSMRKRLIRVAEKLAIDHDAMFCRYDFYCENDKIYFGEITPVCGDLNNYALVDRFAKHLIKKI